MAWLAIIGAIGDDRADVAAGIGHEVTDHGCIRGIVASQFECDDLIVGVCLKVCGGNPASGAFSACVLSRCSDCPVQTRSGAFDQGKFGNWRDFR